MTKTLYQVWLKESDGWVTAEKLYSSKKAAEAEVLACDYAPDEYKIIMIEKEI